MNNSVWILKKDDIHRLSSDEKGKKRLKLLKNVIEVKGFLVCSEYPLHSDNHIAILRAEQILWNSLVLKSRKR